MKSRRSVRIIVLEQLGPIIQRWRYRLQVKGYRNIDRNVIIERNVNLNRVFPESIHVGEGSLIANSTTILCREHVYRNPTDPELPLRSPLYIGKRCFIGVSVRGSAGCEIGDDCLIGAGAIISKDIPSGSVVVGVPARVIRAGIKMSATAVLLD